MAQYAPYLHIWLVLKYVTNTELVVVAFNGNNDVVCKVTYW